MDRDSTWRIRESSDNSGNKPTVNYINITRLPKGGIVNIDIKRQPGSKYTATVEQSPGPSDNYFSRTSNLRGSSSLPGSITNFDDDFFDNTSSRIRSMLRQHQNKFEDPKFTSSHSNEGNVQTFETDGATVVIKQPPLPVHLQGSGSPYRVVIHHPRSQSSDNVVVETSPGSSASSKHIISPRSGSASSISMLESKFPSLKTVSPFGQRSFLISSPLFGEGSGSRLSLFDRFNEHAPPAFFDSKFRSASNPENIHVSKVTVVRDGSGGREKTSRVHNIPIKIEGKDVSADSSRSKSSVVYKIPINLISTKNASPDQQQQQMTTQPPLPIQVQVKPKGISIPIITHKNVSTSDAEAKLSSLTKQLEEEMRLAGTPGPLQPKSPISPPSSLNKPALPSPTSDIAQILPGQKFQTSDNLEKPVATSITDKEDKLIQNKELDDSIQDISNQQQQLQIKGEVKLFGTCNKCNKDVTSEACKALGKLYHSSCFTCSVCNKTLRGKVFYDVKGTTYCEEDYIKSGYQQLAEKCFQCGKVILDMVVQAAGHTYHTTCFKCCQCLKSLQDQTFTIDSKNNLYCYDDYYLVHSPECVVCKQMIKPVDGQNDVGKIMVNDKDYHVECFSCKDCGSKLGMNPESSKYYLIEEDVLCEQCHGKRKNS